MKIVQINCVYGRGSTGVLVQKLHKYLQKQGYCATVWYGRGETATESGVFRTAPEWYGKGNAALSRLAGIPYGGCLMATERLLRFLEQEKPDVVHLHCINGNFVNVYRLVSFLRAKKIRTVVTLHGEFLFTGNCAHGDGCEGWKSGCENCRRFSYDTARSYRKMEAAFRGFGKNLSVIAPSPWEERRAAVAPILREGYHSTIFNGVDTGIFCYTPREKRGNEKIIVHVTALFRDDPTHGKGGWYVLELARRMKHQPVRFLVAGKCQIRGEIPGNVTFLGEIREEKQLASLYRSADLTVIASRRETFSMVCAESLCCGTPVVGFEAGGPECVFGGEYAHFVSYGAVDALLAEAETALKTSWDREAIAREAGQRYGLDAMLRAYEQVYLGG